MTAPLQQPDLVVEASGLRLCYRLAQQRIPSFKEYAIHWLKGSLKYQKLWAVDGVDLRIGRGSSVGIVGRNGAGKSTLLKLISGVLKPTEGSLEVRGSVAPILELGTGFDHELTGYENIFLNALLLGHPHREVEARADEIITFSGLENFIHSPIRNYSSGMIARLGFSIATAWKPAVLILDEVLSVGDQVFKRRCEERMRDLVTDGVTLLMVSHEAAAVRSVCEECLWIDQGKIRACGPVDDVLEQYSELATAGQALRRGS